MARKRYVESERLEIEFEGETVIGWYKVIDGCVEVSSGHSSKATQVGRSPPEMLARIMLRELVQEERSRIARQTAGTKP